MKTFKDIVVNFDDIMYYFYEWETNDKIEYIKEIPLIKVNKKIFKTILNYHIKLDEEYIKKIKNKTLSNQNKITGLIITDGIHAIVLEFSDYGNDIAISTLGVRDELDICEEVFKMKCESIKFVTQDKREFNNVGRKDNMISNYIKLELNSLNVIKDKNKISYFYKELFHRECLDYEKAIKEMKESTKNIKKEHYYLYELMLLSQNKSGLSK